MRRVRQPSGDLEPLGALSNQTDKSVLGTQLGDLGDGANTEPLLTTANLQTALDEHHAKPRVLAFQQLGKHDQVPLLEDPEPQGHVGEQHRIEWKHWHDHHFSRQPLRSTSRQCLEAPIQSTSSRITPSASNRPIRVKIKLP